MLHFKHKTQMSCLNVIAKLLSHSFASFLINFCEWIDDQLVNIDTNNEMERRILQREIQHKSTFCILFFLSCKLLLRNMLFSFEQAVKKQVKENLGTLEDCRIWNFFCIDNFLTISLQLVFLLFHYFTSVFLILPIFLVIILWKIPSFTAQWLSFCCLLFYHPLPLHPRKLQLWYWWHWGKKFYGDIYFVH